jgi:hypothetical protein
MMLAFPGIAIGVAYLLAFWEGIPLAKLDGAFFIFAVGYITRGGLRSIGRK